MLRRATRGVAEAVARGSVTASTSSALCSSSVGTRQTVGHARIPRNAGAKTRWNSSQARGGGDTVVESSGLSRTASGSSSPESLVRAGKPLEFDQAAELVFSTHKSGKLGWDWHAWHFLAACMPAAVAYAWAQHILSSDPEIARMVQESRESRESMGGTSKAELLTQVNVETSEDINVHASIDVMVRDLHTRLANLESILAGQQRNVGVTVVGDTGTRRDPKSENSNRVYAQTASADGGDGKWRRRWKDVQGKLVKLVNRKGIEEK